MKEKAKSADIPASSIKSDNLFPVVGIGASAGGLDAFKKLLRAIPEKSGMAYVLIQHLDPNHESLLPEILQKITNIPVLEITDEIVVKPDHIYVLPRNKIMVATDGVLQLAARPAKNTAERNMPIDIFFSSLAEVHQTHAIGVVLSGTASDGTFGLKAIKDNGGVTFAQDIASAAYEGMPNSAVLAGVVDFILPPEKIPQKILEITESMSVHSGGENQPRQNDDVFKQIIAMLRLRKGTDFTYYKQTTIRRRILRRTALSKNDEPAAYLKFLRENIHEQDALYQDLLIPVTAFFRDPKSFDNLCETVFPQILKNKTNDEPIRVWVAGCSTGEEVYSIAICFKELLRDTRQRVQIFATDISEPAIVKARTGIYKKSEVEGIAKRRIDDYFTKTNGSYQVNKPVRDMCVFAIHNFLKDPPFGKMDFITCRNVLIYMEPYLQKKALTTFHYSLNPKGFLLLGKSETTSCVSELFAAAAVNDKLFSRKDVPGKYMHVASQRTEQYFGTTDNSAKNETIRADFQKTADDILLARYTPAGVVVNEAMDIVHFRGNTGRYLEQASGKPSHNLLKMARQGLAFELRNILHKVKKINASVLKENIPLQVDDNLRNISIEAIPITNTIEPHYLVLFHDNNSTNNSILPVNNKKTASGKHAKDEKDLRIRQLEQELKLAREDMRSITEEQEAANEELQSANEELLSGSEELQSLNEELETNKEELQSTNEELTIVNHEIIGLNELITEARDYSEAIIATIHEPMIVLDKNLRVKSANKSFYKYFSVREEETEGMLLYDLGNKQWNIPRLRQLLDDIIPRNTHFNEFEIAHNFHGIGEKILLLNASRITQKAQQEHLILLAFEDITNQKKIEKDLTEAKVYAELATIIAEEAKIKSDLATQIAEEAVNSKQQFLSNMSHEIRTPMNAIIGFTKAVMKTELSPKQLEYVTAIKISGDELIVLINDILDLAKVDSGKMKFELIPFRLSATITNMLRLLEPKFQEKNLALIKEFGDKIPDVLVGDPVRLNQIMLNLVSNAIKFTAKGSIRVSIRLLEEDKDNVEIEIAVKDTGIGIPEDRTEKIFENFQQADSNTSRLYGGTGLGLAIVKQLVEQQNGTISVTSQLGKGSEFCFRLKFAKTTEKIALDAGHTEIYDRNRKVKVLVVEDMALNRLLMKTLLDDFGFAWEMADNGKIAVERLATKSYDIILMDLQMPEMNGFEATTYIRKELKSAIPIIALTADVTTVDLAKCRAVGMDDYIAKPVDETLLYSKIVNLVDKPTRFPGEIAAVSKPVRCTNLQFLEKRTKSNPKLMMELINVYLLQIPPIITAMKTSVQSRDWESLVAAVHKIIPSFAIMGLSEEYVIIAKIIQEYAAKKQHTDRLPDMVLQIENICEQACKELEEQVIILKTANPGIGKG